MRYECVECKQEIKVYWVRGANNSYNSGSSKNFLHSDNAFRPNGLDWICDVCYQKGNYAEIFENIRSELMED